MVTLWDYFGSIGVVWTFCGMSISRFCLSLVHEVGWFEFWKLMRLRLFFFVRSNQLKKGMEPFCMLLVRAIFYGKGFPKFWVGLKEAWNHFYALGKSDFLWKRVSKILGGVQLVGSPF